MRWERTETETDSSYRVEEKNQIKRYKVVFMWQSWNSTNRNLWHDFTLWTNFFLLCNFETTSTLASNWISLPFSFQMHNTMKYSSTTCLSNSRVLVIVLLVIAIGVDLSIGQQQQQPPELTEEEIAEILHDVEPQTYCSRRLTMIMKQVCLLKDKFLKNKNSKKSRKFIAIFFGKCQLQHFLAAHSSQQQRSRIRRRIW